MSRKKKNIFDFFKGFLIIYGVLIILITIIALIIYINGYSIKLDVVYCFSIVLLGIIICVIGVGLKNKNPYISMGMIAAILGSAFLIIRTNREQLVEPYTEQPQKKRIHFIDGFLLSFGLVILYTPIFIPLLFSAYWYFTIFVLSLILLNIFIGVMKFFFKEKLRYISIGMIALPLIGIILLVVWLIVLMWALFG